MGLWSQLTNWLSSESDSSPRDSGGVMTLDSSPAAHASTESGPKVNSKQVANQPAPELDFPPWWKPGGDTITAPPIFERPCSPDSMTGEAIVLRSLDQTLSDPHIELPSLPHIPQQVLLLTRREDVGMKEIARLISQDQVLSADLLRQANSVLYGGRTPVKDLSSALARLGMRGIRSFTISQTIKQLTIRMGGGARRSRGELLWRESLASAYVMSSLAEFFDLDSNDAFLAGLLHDIGKVVVLRACHEAEQQSGKEVTREMFDYLCQEYHELLGELVADRWQMPEGAGAVMTRHHGELDPEDPHLVLRAAVQLTDATTSLLCYAPERPYDLLAMPAARHLGMSETPATIKMLRLLPEVVGIALSDIGCDTA